MAPRAARKSEPAYRRLDVEERRTQLLELGRELFTKYGYDELSMARIARHAGISKALLYHYFPTKHRFFEAALEQAATELAARTQPDPELPPVEALRGSVDGFLSWIEENASAYEKLMASATSVPEVRDLIATVRDATSARIVEGLHPEGPAPPKIRAATRGWLWFMDGVILDWLEHRDVAREELRDFLLGSLLGALIAAGWTPPVE
jgi:AcrR family transcriptional regulator